MIEAVFLIAAYASGTITTTPMPSEAICAAMIQEVQLAATTANAMPVKAFCKVLRDSEIASLEKATHATAAEKDAIRRHIERFWNIPAGVKDAENESLEVRVTTKPDGTVTEARIVNAPQSPSSFWLAAADSARRAVRLASPLPIPAGKSNQFQDFTIGFSARQAIGGK